MTRIPPAFLYSLLLVLPLLLLLVLPVPCLGTQCALLTAVRLSAPSSLDPDGLAGFCAWALGPLLAAPFIFLLGLAGYWLTGGPDPSRIAWVVVWALFTAMAFVLAWYGIILVTSIGASETPPKTFLSITARMALTVIVLAQPLILIWLVAVNRVWKARRPAGLAVDPR